MSSIGYILFLVDEYPSIPVKEKYGSDYDEEGDSESDSESDESEDEDGEELTPTVDAAILRTLARIKRKDPDIYDSNKNIFGGACDYSKLDISVSPCLFGHVEEQGKIAPTANGVRVSKDKVCT